MEPRKKCKYAILIPARMNHNHEGLLKSIKVQVRYVMYLYNREDKKDKTCKIAKKL